MSERTVANRWDMLIKIASLCCTAVILPGIGWAFSVTTQINNLDSRINMLTMQIDSDRRGMSSIIEELRQLRSSVDSMKSDVLQRIAKVETKLENR